MSNNATIVLNRIKNWNTVRGDMDATSSGNNAKLDDRAPELILSNKRDRQRRRRQHSKDEEGDGVVDNVVMDGSFVVNDDTWKRFQLLQTHSLRISVSDVAACSGFHPYKDLVSLFVMDHVYQGAGGNALLEHDTQLLGIQMKSQWEEVQEIAKIAGTETQKAMKIAMNNKLTSVEHVETVRTNVEKEAIKSKKLTREQIEVLQEGARHSVYTNFGTHWESHALQIYERQCGSDVHHQNSELVIWPFERYGEDTVQPMQPESYAFDFNATTSSGTSDDTSQQQQQQHHSRSPLQLQSQQSDVIDLVQDEDENHNHVDGDKSTGRNSIDEPTKSPRQKEFLQNSGEDKNVHPIKGQIHCKAFGSDANEKMKDTSKDPAADQALHSTKSAKYDIDEKSDNHRVSMVGSEFSGAKRPSLDNSTSPRSQEQPFFTLRGCVDGIRDELIPTETHGKGSSNDDTNSDDDSWVMKSVIVECKHRMRQLKSSIPLYEIIQATTYALMYQVSDVDLVQVLRRTKRNSDDHHHQQKEKRQRQQRAAAKNNKYPRVTDTVLSNASPSENDNDVYHHANDEDCGFAKHDNNHACMPKKNEDEVEATNNKEPAGNESCIDTKIQANSESKPTLEDSRLTSSTTCEAPMAQNYEYHIAATRKIEDSEDIQDVKLAGQREEAGKDKTKDTRDDTCDVHKLEKFMKMEIGPNVIGECVRASISPFVLGSEVSTQSRRMVDTKCLNEKQGNGGNKAVEVDLKTDNVPEDAGMMGQVDSLSMAAAGSQRNEGVSGASTDLKDNKAVTDSNYCHKLEADNEKTAETTDGEEKNDERAGEGNEEASVSMEIRIDRIRIDDAIFHHRYHWNSVILPRLRSWVDAVYRIRRDDAKRYALLAALVSSPVSNSSISTRTTISPESSWKIIFEECPWLEHCDTAYSREFIAKR